MPLISLDDEDQRWVPTNVNVTVLRARALRTKGKQGSRYVYTVIQLGKVKYTTGLTEKAAEPEWNEECSLELQPGLLECVGAHPPGSGDLILTVMLRVLIGLDVFLGEAVVPLDKVFQSGTCPRNEWVKLHSKAGRKEKERGELQLTIQFTRNNMTASMYDLTVQDKPRSAFGKLKDRVTGKKKDVESSSAILPGRFAALSSSTSQSFQEAGGGENQIQAQESIDEGKSKVKGFFLKGKLRKNSDTRSCSSLASESSMASSSGEPFVPIELCSTPVYSSRVVEPFYTDSGGVKVMAHKRAHSDEASKITVASRPNTVGESQNPLLSKSTLCINGSHVYSEPIYSKGPGSLPIKRTILEKCSPLSRSLQNLTRRNEDAHRRSSVDKSKKEIEGDAEGSSASAPMVDVITSDRNLVHATAPLLVAYATTDVADKGRKLRKTLFSSGRSDSLPTKPEPSQEGRMRGWFGSSDTQNKPRLGVPPKVESSPETSASLSPCYPTIPPRSLPLISATSHMPCSPVDPHSNPFSHPSPLPPSVSPTNPFLTRLQKNPFFEELIAEEALKSPPALSGYHNSPFNHYSAFPVRRGLPSTVCDSTPNRLPSIKRDRPLSVARQRSLPALMPGTPETATVNSNNAIQASHPLSECRGEWDEFEALATSRLKSPVGTPTRPPSATIPPSPHNTCSIESCSIEPNMGIFNERISKDCNQPVLAPRRPVRTPVPFQERCSDSWLGRAQELAVQKEASVLFQTDLASLRHRERYKEGKNKVSQLGKDLHCAALEQNVNIHSTTHTVQRSRDENLNSLENKNLTDRDLNIAQKNSQFGYEHMQPNSQNSTSDPNVPGMPFCHSDCDTTVSESLCSDFQVQINPESSSEPKPFAGHQIENKFHARNITSPDTNNNNTHDPSQFAFIDCDSSTSDVKQITSGMRDEGSNKALTQCPDATDLGPQILSVCELSSVPSQDLLKRTAELEPISAKETSDTVFTSEMSKNDPYEKSCDNLEQPSVQSHTDSNVRFESEKPNHKESSVSLQTNPQQDTDDKSVTAQLKPEATEDNAGLNTPRGVECALIYDEIKTETVKLKPTNSSSIAVSENQKVSESPSTLKDSISFKDLHDRVAPRGSGSPSKTEVRSARIRTSSTRNSPKTGPSAILPSANSDISPTKPSLSDLLLHKTPSPSFLHSTATSDPSLSSLMHYPTTRPGSGSILSEASYTTSTIQLQATAKHTLTPEEAEPASSRPPAEESSPHPVKPLTNTAVPGEKKSVLEKLRSSIHPGRSTQQNVAEPEKSPVCMSEAYTYYQTLSNMELIALLLQQEGDAERQQAESELQATLLEKRETELKKLKAQVRDLEDYIDKLLVRIMEQTPTLLQVRGRPK